MALLVGKPVPEISLKAVKEGQIEEFSLSSLQGQYALLFFYPLNFTFVCPTELHAFQEYLEEFRKRNTAVIGCSVDSCFSHLAWLNLSRQLGGIAGIQYPLIADVNKELSRAFGILKEDEGIAYRGLFLIDRQGIVRHQVVNDLPLGRSVPEALRMVDALIFHDTYGEVCPANWNQGSKAMRATPEGLLDYFANASS